MKLQNWCPFCGENHAQVVISMDGKGKQVECLNCGSRGPCGMLNDDEAIKAWENGDTGYKRHDLRLLEA